MPLYCTCEINYLLSSQRHFSVLCYYSQYGCNPTGMTASVKRRKEVLALSREHNFLILEGLSCTSLYVASTADDQRKCKSDDPYYYLYYGTAPRPPSYFTLELEEPEVGRVLRFDSLSKILSAGLRIGFTSGPEPIVQAMDRHVHAFLSPMR